MIDSTNTEARGISRKGAVERFVNERATSLERDFLSERKGSVARARRDLANLRNAARKPPGTDSTIWEITTAELPNLPTGNTPRDDLPTAEEWAAHLALTLFAIHQQSRDQRMHVSKVGFGKAIARLERKTGDDGGEGPSPVRRRFNLVISSQTLAELAHHLRGLIGQLRAENIALDYGLLAGDLFDFQQPGGIDRVSRRWMLQYYHFDAEVPDGGEASKADDAGTIAIETTEEKS